MSGRISSLFISSILATWRVCVSDLYDYSVSLKFGLFMTRRRLSSKRRSISKQRSWSVLLGPRKRRRLWLQPLPIRSDCQLHHFLPTEASVQVKLAFIDDRKSKIEADEREKVLREARLAAAATRGSEPSTSPEPSRSKQVMPGSGHVLGLDMPPEDDRAEDSEED